jgi:hypothetical protein
LTLGPLFRRDRSCSESRICGGYRFRQQHCVAARGMVDRASLVALDLLDSGNCNARNDGVRLLRDSAACCHGYASQLARIRIFQRWARASLRRAGSGRAPRLAELRSRRGDVDRRNVSCSGCSSQAHASAKSDLESVLPQKSNVIILALSVFVFTFVHLATIILIPGFLGNVQQYRPLQTGHALAWVALPMFAVACRAHH